MEYATAGHVLAGFHEVVVNDATLDSIERAKAAGKSLWRISSTCFAHFASDVTLEPVGHFSKTPEAASYPALKVGKQVADELAAINLSASGTGADTVSAM